MPRAPLLSFAALLAISSLLGCSSPAEVPDVAYDARFGDATTLDVYLPSGSGTRRPAVLFFHGGLWNGHDRSEYASAAKRLASSGFVTATANYRVVPDAGYPAAIQDARCALAFLRANAAEYGLDPGRVAVVGYSAGGHLASMLGAVAGAPELEADCAAGTTGPANAVVASSGIHAMRLRKGDKAVEAFLGGSLDALPERWDRASPISHVAPHAPPYLLVRSDFDFVVSAQQSEAMQSALEAAGNHPRALLLYDEGHFLAAGADVGGLYYGTVEDRPELWTTLIDFLYDTLGAP